jgi:hypothetical protein
VEKPEGNRLLARPMHRWEDNVNVGPKYDGMAGWTGSISLRTGTSGEHLCTRFHKTRRVS